MEAIGHYPNNLYKIEVETMSFRDTVPGTADRISTPKDLKQIEARTRGKQKRLAVTSTWNQHGITEHWQYGALTNHTYEGLFGLKAAGLKKQKNISPKANLRDAMTPQELIEVAFAEELEDRKIRQDNIQGFKPCAKVCRKTGEMVAEFIATVLQSQV
jgi:hypothetical protein